MIDRQAWAEVDLSAIRRNVRRLVALSGGESGLCAVVKADAYGHGAAPVARACLEAGATSLAVAMVDEGLALRAAGVVAPILVMGYTGPEGAGRAVVGGLSVAAVSAENARMIAAQAELRGRIARLHLKVDTGMSRLGVPVSEAAAAATAIASTPGAMLEGVFSHFADADDPGSDFSRLQLERFNEATAAIEAAGVRGFARHIANSSAYIRIPASRLDMGRVGIAVYGLGATGLGPDVPALAPAMALKARVTQVRTLPIGDSVGYGRTFVARRASRIGTLPLGYADGVTRGLSNRGWVGFPSGRAPIVGTVCMDQFMVDLTDLPDEGEGSTATLFGPGGPSAGELAELLGTIDYEIISSVSVRVPRIYLDSRLEEEEPC
ncbi:MAG TPA: alanine racemase [Spirochaetia bacterium]|nr:alanine racemase [Spirochaetia bacterium]